MKTFCVNVTGTENIGLKNESDEILKLACERLGWSPRELEFLYWHLASHPATTSALMTTEQGLLLSNAQQFFVGKTFVLLSPDAQKAGQALAIYGRPIEPEGVAYMLEPYGATADTEESLDTLVNMRLVRRQGARYYLQYKQRAYFLSLIPVKAQLVSSGSKLPLHARCLVPEGRGLPCAGASSLSRSAKRRRALD